MHVANAQRGDAQMRPRDVFWVRRTTRTREQQVPILPKRVPTAPPKQLNFEHYTGLNGGGDMFRAGVHVVVGLDDMG